MRYTFRTVPCDLLASNCLSWHSVSTCKYRDSPILGRGFGGLQGIVSRDWRKFLVVVQQPAMMFLRLGRTDADIGFTDDRALRSQLAVVEVFDN